MIKLDCFAGWKLISGAVLMMYMFSIMFYIFKYDGNSRVSWIESGYFMTCMIQLVFALVFTSIHK